MTDEVPESLSGSSVDLTVKTEVTTTEQQNQASSSTNGSPKSSDAKKAQDGSKNRRKRKPKKVSQNDTSISDNEVAEPMDIDIDLTNKISNQSINSENSKQESDCETIEKIAKMVNNITSETEKPAQTESQGQQDKLIKEVENRMEEMFADDKNEPDSNLSEQNVKTEAPAVDDVDSKEKPKIVKTKAARKKKPDINSKKQKKNVNGTKSKDNKKNDKSSKSKGSEKGKQDKNDTKKSQKSKENGGRSKFKSDAAPYLQISRDGSFSIVNQTLNGDDDADKTSNKQKKPIATEKHRQHIRGLHVSTLSNKYDADKRDATWICVFCKLGPHKFKLGDLFGPYIISKNSNEYALCLEDPSNDIFRQSNQNKFSPIKSPTNTPKRKRKNSDGNAKKVTSPAVNGPDVSDEVFTGMTPIDENSYEIWFHEDCIVWSPGTYIIGTKIIGLEAAVWQSTRNRCKYCLKNGAMITCLTRGCSKDAHIVCANKTWKLCEDFKTYCDQHIT